MTTPSKQYDTIQFIKYTIYMKLMFSKRIVDIIHNVCTAVKLPFGFTVSVSFYITIISLLPVHMHYKCIPAHKNMQSFYGNGVTFLTAKCYMHEHLLPRNYRISSDYVISNDLHEQFRPQHISAWIFHDTWGHTRSIFPIICVGPSIKHNKNFFKPTKIEARTTVKEKNIL